MIGSPEHGIERDAETVPTYRTAVIDLDSVHAPVARHPARWHPWGRRLIVFSREIPRELYRLPVRSRTHAFRDVIRAVELLLSEEVGRLRSEGSRAIAVPVFFPVSLEDGKMRGVLSLRDLAADAGIGTIGRNGLLLVPGYGCRAALGAVVTDAELPLVRPACMLQCLECGRCQKACPADAIGSQGVDPFRCLNVSSITPGLMNQVLRWAARGSQGGIATRMITSLVNGVARFVPMPCSVCVTACPLSGMEEKS